MNVLKWVKNKTVENAAWIMSEKIMRMIISLLLIPLTARYLGPSNYGLLSYANSFIAFFAAFCNLGINSLLVKELVDYPRKEGEVLGTAIVLRIIASMLSAITIIFLVSVLDRNEPITVLAVALCSVGLLFQACDVFRYWFQRYLKSRYTALATLGAYIATSAYRVFLLIMGRSVIWFALMTVVDHIVMVTLLIFFYCKHGGKKLGFSWKYGKELLSRSKYFILPGMMVAIYAQTDKLMLKQMLDATQTAFYSAAVSVNGAWCFVLSAIIQSLYPSIMEAHHSGNVELFRKKNRQMYAMVFYCSMVAAVMLSFFAEIVIRILYGDAYMPAATLLRIVCWYTAFSYLGVAREAWVVSENRQKHLIWVYLMAALINVVLNWVLIPRWGANGAAIASVITQLLTGILLPFFMKSLKENAKLMLEGIMLQKIR